MRTGEQPRWSSQRRKLLSVIVIHAFNLSNQTGAKQGSADNYYWSLPSAAPFWDLHLAFSSYPAITFSYLLFNCPLINYFLFRYRDATCICSEGKLSSKPVNCTPLPLGTESTLSHHFGHCDPFILELAAVEQESTLYQKRRYSKGT